MYDERIIRGSVFGSEDALNRAQGSGVSGEAVDRFSRESEWGGRCVQGVDCGEEIGA